MGKSIYTYYKERLIEIGGKNKCLYLKNVVRRGAYDIGKLLEGREKKIEEFVSFLWSSGKRSLTLIDKEQSRDIADNIGLPPRSQNAPDTDGMTMQESESAWETYQDNIVKDRKKIIENEIVKIRELKREVEEIEKETGRYELYIGYPFVFGSVNQGASKTLIKAPLLLFPVKIEIGEDDTVELRLNSAEKIKINHALIYAYAQSKKLDIEELELDFDDMSQFKNVKAVCEYLGASKIRIDCKNSKTLYTYSKFKEPAQGADLSVRYAAVLARLSLSSSIYNDYTELEKRKLTNDAISELLRSSGSKARSAKKLIKERKKRLSRAKRDGFAHTYAIKMLDYSQSEVVRRVDEMGNMVIYGPPGTGKSQTIVNIITDAMCKNKRVLVVSQKKAALDVVYSRLGTLSEKAMYINDEQKEKRAFYENCFSMHQKDEVTSLADISALQKQYNEIEERIKAEEKTLDSIYHTLCDTRPFGLSLSEMYSSSNMLQKNSSEYNIYQELLSDKEVLSLNYKEMRDALFAISANNLSQMYYKFIESKEKNPIIDCMLPELDIQTLGEVKGVLSDLQRSRGKYFNIVKYPYTRQVLAQYARMDDEKSFDKIVKLEASLSSSKRFNGKARREVAEGFRETLGAIREYVRGYDCLLRVMTRDGYISVIDNILRGNSSYVKLVYEALDSYIGTRDIARLIESLDKNMLAILNFAYSTSRSYSNYISIIEKLPAVKIYHEVTILEEKCKEELSKTVDFDNITSRIYKLKEAQLEISYKLCASKNSSDYREIYEKAPNAKDYLYQISKEQKFWPIRKTMEHYSDFILALYPCWLLSPENVSNILPLKKNLFDVVIFDEASQVFIESTIPTIYRGRNIVVAGDAKQLRPSQTFMKRYLGADPDTKEDLSVQAALEVDSLLDLAVARYESANLNYHYRSRYEELINFSNAAFYQSHLQIAPNISGAKDSRPIERHKVDGIWQDRKNREEAKRVVALIAEIFKNRKHEESIGVITFNSDQQSCISDEMDAFAKRDPEFRIALTKERYRTENGEDTSLFIKNLENVQGDERDIIIFSIGYAPNKEGKLYTNFGSLSTEGGENRLNVAITRAKSKIIVVTSIEPEDLKVDTAKNDGPRLLKEYLTYVRAVSDGDTEHADAILAGLCPQENTPEDIVTDIPAVSVQIKERLEKLGYAVHLDLGNKNSRISLAIYDEALDRYLVGVELDTDAFMSSESSMERDVYKPKFLEARGWTLIRVFCREWWLSPQKVIKTITSLAEKNKKKL